MFNCWLESFKCVDVDRNEDPELIYLIESVAMTVLRTLRSKKYFIFSGDLGCVEEFAFVVLCNQEPIYSSPPDPAGPASGSGRAPRHPARPPRPRALCSPLPLQENKKEQFKLMATLCNKEMLQLKGRLGCMYKYVSSRAKYGHTTHVIVSVVT
jgi:hypothetical protein